MMVRICFPSTYKTFILKTTHMAKYSVSICSSGCWLTISGLMCFNSSIAMVTHFFAHNHTPKKDT